MENAEISFNLVGYPLGEDIFSEQGLLLLKKGTILKEIHILLLQKYRFGTTVAIGLDIMETASNGKKSPSAKPYKSFQLYIKDTFLNLLKNGNMDLSDLRERYHNLVDVSLCDLSILKVLQSEVGEEEKLYQHSINVGIFSAIIGKLLGYNRIDCLLLAEMGLFHEIGMLSIEQDIKEIEDPLNIEDVQQLQKHTEIGYQLLKSNPNLDTLIPLAALNHHERLNGSGYPHQLTERDIPYFVQIISVADSFNAMSMKLHNGKKNPPFTVIYELIDETHRNLLNPAVVIPFVRYIMRQNLHEQVVLTNGEEAQIIFIHENEPYQPLIRVQDEFFDLRKDSSLKIVDLADKALEESFIVN